MDNNNKLKRDTTSSINQQKLNRKLSYQVLHASKVFDSCSVENLNSSTEVMTNEYAEQLKIAHIKLGKEVGRDWLAHWLFCRLSFKVH